MKVKPIKRRKVNLNDLDVGKRFTMGGIEYIKLDDYDVKYGGVLATTIYPLSIIESACQHDSYSLEERAVKAYAENLPKNKHHISFSNIPDTDDVQKYGFIIHKHIRDCWYVDAGESNISSMKSGDYFYVNEFGDVDKSNEYDEAKIGMSIKVGIRAFYGINLSAEVIIDV